MKPATILCATIAALALTLVRATPAPSMSAPLRLCVVEVSPNAITGPEFQQVFTARMGAAIAAATDAKLALTCEAVSVREAANRIKCRACEAVLVIGADRPSALQRIDAVTLAGTLGWNRNCATVYLIVGAGDPKLRRWLDDGFHAALLADIPHGKKIARGE
jgi:hypothetical protein